MTTSPSFAGGKCVHTYMLIQTEEMNAFLLFILKSETYLEGEQCVYVNNESDSLYVSSQSNRNWTLFLKKIRKHSLLPQLFKYLSKRGFCFGLVWGFFVLERLNWCGISGAVFLTQCKLNLFAPTLFIIWRVIPGWRVACLLFCKPLHYHSC